MPIVRLRGIAGVEVAEVAASARGLEVNGLARKDLERLLAVVRLLRDVEQRPSGTEDATLRPADEYALLLDLESKK